MKLNTNIIVLSLATALCSCSKKEAATQPAAETSVTAETAKAVEAVAPSEPAKVVAETAPPAVETPKAIEAPKAVEVAKPVEDTSIQELIAKARSLAAEKKYAEASAVVQQLSSKALNADQTTLVEGLKQQIQKALTAKATENAVGALGNALPK
jgi:hypothetical protein